MQKWKELSRAGRIVWIVQLAASLIAVTSAVLQLLGIWNDALNVCVPMLGVVNLCNACLQWKANRIGACFSAGTAAFAFIVSAVVGLS